ncbi:hypothetical protein F5887DRAFT_1079491 [Amanita rubescens]|nr:hypothetical protein F5887DRAFT_1079491 [Amanita rubescens]
MLWNTPEDSGAIPRFADALKREDDEGPVSDKKLKDSHAVKVMPNAIGVEKENVGLDAMASAWHYQNKANQALPLKSEGSFDVMWKNVKSLKDAPSQVIFINHPIYCKD